MPGREAASSSRCRAVSRSSEGPLPGALALEAPSALAQSEVTPGPLTPLDPLEPLARASLRSVRQACGVWQVVKSHKSLSAVNGCMVEGDLCCVGALRLWGSACALCELITDFAGVLEEVAPLAARVAQGLVQNCLSPVAQRFEGRPLADVMPVVMVITIMGMLYFAFVACWLPQSGVGMMSCGPVSFHAAFVLALLSYHRGVMTDPGSIPDSWRDCPQWLGVPQDGPFERKRTTGEFRFCSKERKYKPDRAHFCKPLQRNVLRMDHYCPWMSNCVGYCNHKFFVLFLLYTTIASSLALFCIVQALAQEVYPAGTTAFLLGSAALAALLTAVIAPFLLLHLWLLSKNMTTVEFCEQLSEHGSYISPYDVGVVENLKSILGGCVWLWLLPVGGPDGEGLVWPRQALPEVD